MLDFLSDFKPQTVCSPFACKDAQYFIWKIYSLSILYFLLNDLVVISRYFILPPTSKSILLHKMAFQQFWKNPSISKTKRQLNWNNDVEFQTQTLWNHHHKYQLSEWVSSTKFHLECSCLICCECTSEIPSFHHLPKLIYFISCGKNEVSKIILQNHTARWCWCFTDWKCTTCKGYMLEENNKQNKFWFGTPPDVNEYRVPHARTPQDMDGTLTLIFAKSENT